jgi:hypothetical protein
LVTSLVVVLVGSAGCASIFSSGPDPVSFGSDPEGAEVLVNGERRGATPVTLQLHPDKQYIVTLRRQGYEDATFSLSTHVQGGWVVLDILAGILGVAVETELNATRDHRRGIDNYIPIRRVLSLWRYASDPAPQPAR